MPAIGVHDKITGLDILRTKGLFTVKTSRREGGTETAQYIVQGVKELYEIKELPHRTERLSEGSSGALVLIGKGLRQELETAVRQTILAA